MEHPPPVNHVFIDFENIHEFDPGVIGTRNISLTLLVGAKQTKLDVALVEKLFQHAGSVKFVRLASSGRNALDFALAYYMGRAAAADPGGQFHIVSGDKGFDPLVEHLNSRNICAFRHGDLSTLLVPRTSRAQSSVPAPLPPKAKAPTKPKAGPKQKPVSSGKKDGVVAALALLNRVPARRPKKYSSLVSHLKAHLGKGTTESEVKSLIEDLQNAGHFSVDEKGVITYGAATKGEPAFTLSP